MNKKVPILARQLLKRLTIFNEKHSIVEDFEETFEEIAKSDGIFQAKLWYWSSMLKSIPSYFHNLIYWSYIMLSNYLKIAFRTMKRHSGYSLINILGLAVGIACCSFILLFVLFELSYDNYHGDIDRIFIVGQSRQSEVGHSVVGGNMPLMAPTLKEKYPQVEYAARLNSGWITQVTTGENVFKEQGLWHANPDIFNILSIPFLQGSAETLNRPNTAVLTAEKSYKYFGEKNPIGETITIGDKDYEITGIVQNPPRNTVYKYQIIMSWKTIENDEHWTRWEPGMAATDCIIKLKKGVNAKEFEKLSENIPHEYCGEVLKKRGHVYKNFLYPVQDLHLHAISGEQIRVSASMIYVYIFSVVGGLILLIACMNFMNIATARSANRSGEVGMRKVIGARRQQIIWQFLGESLIISFSAAIIALFFVALLLPVFNGLAQTDFSYQHLFQPSMLIGLISIILIVGIAAGSYPAFFLSAFRPIAILRGKLRTGLKGTTMRKVLVVKQFTISIALIIATFIVYKQITFMKEQPLGFDKEQKLVFQLKAWEMITERYETVKNEFLKHPSILNATATSGIPGSMINRTWVYPADQEREKGQAFRSLRCDQDFLKVYGVEMVAGRQFNKEIQTDVYNAFIINEAGVKAFGWGSPDEALGKQLWERQYPIIGVTKNYHWWGLQREIEPMIMRVVPDLFRSITLTVNTKNLKETIDFIEHTYAQLFPGDLFEYFFVDANFDLQYQAEERLGKIFRIFTILGLFIACLGLFGMASFIAEQRTKEIGIRKVLGASLGKIIILLSKEFVKWILIANIIAWPLAYLAGQKWLQSFAYRTNPGIEIFILSALLAFLIAIITVSYQSIKAAFANPVESLRYE